MQSTLDARSKQVFQSDGLSAADRKLLIHASLTLYLRRLNHGIEVTKTDLLRVAHYAPEEAV